MTNPTAQDIWAAVRQLHTPNPPLWRCDDCGTTYSCSGVFGRGVHCINGHEIPSETT
jgi:hypothetical protein